jgi:hypothetical protein
VATKGKIFNTSSENRLSSKLHSHFIAGTALLVKISISILHFNVLTQQLQAPMMMMIIIIIINEITIELFDIWGQSCEDVNLIGLAQWQDLF